MLLDTHLESLYVRIHLICAQTRSLRSLLRGTFSIRMHLILTMMGPPINKPLFF